MKTEYAGYKLLGNPISLQEADADVLGARNSNHPSNYGQGRWGWFKATLKEGDQIFKFTSGSGSWTNRCGRSGLAIVRSGEIIHTYVRAMN